MDRCRTVIIEYGAPRNLWGFAVENICHTINCTRILARNDKTVHELIHGLKPDVSKLVPFYVPGIAYVPADERRDKQAQLVALSSCHAELQAPDEVIRIVIHLITILQFMQIQNQLRYLLMIKVQLNCLLYSKLHIGL